MEKIIITFQPVLDHEIPSLNLTINSWCHLNPYQLLPHASVQGGSEFELAGLTPSNACDCRLLQWQLTWLVTWLARRALSSSMDPMSWWKVDEKPPPSWRYFSYKCTQATSIKPKPAHVCHMRSLREASLGFRGAHVGGVRLEGTFPFVFCQMSML